MTERKAFELVEFKDLTAGEKSAVTRLLERISAKTGTNKNCLGLEIARIHRLSVSVFITSPKGVARKSYTLHAFVGPRGGIRIASAYTNGQKLDKDTNEEFTE